MVIKLGRLRVPHKASVAIREVLLSPRTLVVLPGILVGAYLVGGENLLLAAGVCLPLAAAFGGRLTPPRVDCGPRDPLTGLPMADTAARFIGALLQRPSRRRQTVVMAIGLDDGPRTAPRVGPHAWELALAQAGDRITDVLRGGDQIVRLDGPAFGIVLRRLRRPGIEDALAIAERVQRSIAAPIHLQGAKLQVTASVGICFESDRPDGDPALFLAAAEAALEEAQVHGENSVRLFSGELRSRLQAKSELAETVTEALGAGEITSWFQPQICARTGRITGAEALARWEHPGRGTLLPEDFLDPIAARGLGPRLFRVVMASACAAMRDWDRAGFPVPRVSVNIDGATLRDPLIAEQIEWELDRYDLTPDRFGLEVLEDVAAAPEDEILSANLARIGALGCRIDLDGFGMAQAPLASISRFGAHRLKIDRSFVIGAMTDPEQRRMSAAIVEMARSLDLETVAEGVATEKARDLFETMGCDHLQGFGIARPLPAAEMPGWILSHHARWGLAPAAGAAATIRAGETA